MNWMLFVDDECAVVVAMLFIFHLSSFSSPSIIIGAAVKLTHWVDSMHPYRI